MTIEEMKKRKKELGYSNKRLAELSGVPETTIQKVFSGKTDAPRRETILKLEKVLKEYPGPAGATASEEEYPFAARFFEAAVREPKTVYGNTAKKQGEYTLEDYLALPDDQRVELIDGYFFEMEAPTTLHQAIGGYIYKILLDHVIAHGGQCMPFMSPVDVQLDENNRTVVQPDVLIVCDRKKFRNGRVFGAPDFIAEVLSPSTRRKDMQLKLAKYGNAGVREYWMIDPKKKKIVVYDLEHEEIPMVYGFGDTVPVMVWDNACTVDFEKMDALISFLYEDVQS